MNGSVVFGYSLLATVGSSEKDTCKINKALRRIWRASVLFFNQCGVPKASCHGMVSSGSSA